MNSVLLGEVKNIYIRVHKQRKKRENKEAGETRTVQQTLVTFGKNTSVRNYSIHISHCFSHKRGSCTAHYVKATESRAGYPDNKRRDARVQNGRENSESFLLKL